MSWIGASIGLSVSSPQVASTAGFAWLFPLTFLSNAFVPTETLPTWLRIFAEWNPITSIVAAARYLFGYPMEVAADAPFSLQHPIITTIIWLVVITAVFMPIAGRKFNLSVLRELVRVCRALIPSHLTQSFFQLNQALAHHRLHRKYYCDSLIERDVILTDAKWVPGLCSVWCLGGDFDLNACCCC